MIKRSEQRELPAVEGFGISLKAQSRRIKLNTSNSGFAGWSGFYKSRNMEM